MSVVIVMPRAGLTMVEGTISTWKAEEGSHVDKGQPIMEYENEKNVIEYEALDSGILHITAQEGDTVPVGDPIGILAASQEEYDTLLLKGNSPPSSKTEVERVPEHPRSADAVPHPPVTPTAHAGRVVATGLAKKMAADAHIDLADVSPTGGPDGRRITASDVEAYMQARRAAPAFDRCAAEEDDIHGIPWTGVRKVIAQNMFNSLQHTAQNTSVTEVDATELLALRAKLVEEQEYLGYKVTINDLLCKMLAAVMVNHPYLNATFDGKTLFTHRHVDLAVAVAAEDGLAVPVIKHADTLSLRQIHETVQDLASRAKEKTLQPSEQSGGSLTITNVGMFPVDFGTPILNAPQVAIFGFGRPSLKPAVMQDGSIVPRSIMHIFVTYDHRVGDGLIIGRAMRDVQHYIEHPEILLL